MDLIKNVFYLSEKFMQDPKHVKIDWVNTSSITSIMAADGKSEFKEKHEIDEKTKEEIMLQLVAGSINYCYWYGTHEIRPGNSSSSKMFELVRQAYNKNRIEFYNDLVPLLSLNRLPLVEKRHVHVAEAMAKGDSFINDILTSDKRGGIDWLLENLVANFPGYASDMFLKRAFLFFLMLHRTFGWYPDALNVCPVPADYQVPKVLWAEGCLRYSKELQNKIYNNELIPQHSREECEIRAATILVCQEFVKQLGWNISEVDGWFWLRRNQYNDCPFHLTVTTDY